VLPGSGPPVGAGLPEGAPGLQWPRVAAADGP
jgi:hypothetical protein